MAFHFTMLSSFGSQRRHVCHSRKSYTFIVTNFRILSSLLSKETQSFRGRPELSSFSQVYTEYAREEGVDGHRRPFKNVDYDA